MEVFIPINLDAIERTPIKLKVPLDKGLEAQVAADSSGKLKGVHKDGRLWF